MADDELDEMTVVPLPASETKEEHKRIRSSNDRIRSWNEKASRRATIAATTRLPTARLRLKSTRRRRIASTSRSSRPRAPRAWAARVRLQ